MASSFQLTFTICYCLYCWCFLTPLLLYHVYRFYLLRNTAIICKRHYRIVIAINIVISIYLIFSRPALIIALYKGSRGSTHNCIKSLSQCSIFQTIADLSDSVSSHGWSSLLTIRMWLIFFETTYNQQVSEADRKWTQFINPNSDKSHHNSDKFKHWTHSVRDTLGKERWLLTRLFIPYYTFAICFSIFSIITSFKYDLLLYIPQLITLTVLWCKTSKPNDALKIRHEMRLILRCAAFAIFMLAVSSVLLSQFETHQIYIIYTFQVFFALWHTIYGLCTTKWVISYSGLYVPAVAQLLLFMNSTKSIQKPANVPHVPSLSDALSKTETLCIFMKHLCNEWSMESLLCVIECYQFKQFMKDKLNTNMKRSSYEDKTYLHHLSLDIISLPQSAIVYDTEMSAMDKMKQLMDKYIRGDSEFQVNISHYCRENILSLGADEENKMSDVDFYQCFDEVLSELMNLMQDSYFRFINDGGFCQLSTSMDQQIESRSPSPSFESFQVDNDILTA